MRVGKNEKPAFFVSDLGKVLEIHRIVAVRPAFQRVVNYFPAIFGRDNPERMVNRRLDDDFLVGLEEGIDHEADSLHDSRYVAEPFPFCIPSVVFPNPGDDGWPIILRFHSVAQYRML